MWRKIITNENFKLAPNIIRTNNSIRNIIERLNKQSFKIKSGKKNEGNN